MNVQNAYQNQKLLSYWFKENEKYFLLSLMIFLLTGKLNKVIQNAKKARETKKAFCFFLKQAYVCNNNK